jgi:hypothetical protein
MVFLEGDCSFLFSCHLSEIIQLTIIYTNSITHYDNADDNNENNLAFIALYYSQSILTYIVQFHSTKFLMRYTGKVLFSYLTNGKIEAQRGSHSHDVGAG